MPTDEPTSALPSAAALDFTELLGLTQVGNSVKATMAFVALALRLKAYSTERRYNVEDFGAVANGALPTNGTPSPSTTGIDGTINDNAIAAAIAKMVADGQGGILWFPSTQASYVISAKVRLPIHCRADGPRGATLLLAGNTWLMGSTYNFTTTSGSAIGTRTFNRRGCGIVETADEKSDAVALGNLTICGNLNHQWGQPSGHTMSLTTVGCLADAVTDTGTFVVTLGTAMTTALAGKPFRLRVGQEIIQVTATIDGTNKILTCTPQAHTTEAGGTGWASVESGRGFDRSTAAAHIAGEAVFLVFDGFYCSGEAITNANEPATLSPHLIDRPIIMQVPGNGISIRGTNPTGAANMRGVMVFDAMVDTVDGIGLFDDATATRIDGVTTAMTGREGCWSEAQNARFGPRNRFSTAGQKDQRHGDGLVVLGVRSIVNGECRDCMRHGARIVVDCEGQINCDSNGQGYLVTTTAAIVSTDTAASPTGHVTSSSAIFTQAQVGMNVTHAAFPADAAILSVDSDGKGFILGVAGVAVQALSTNVNIAIGIGVNGYGVQLDNGSADCALVVKATDRAPASNSRGGTEASQLAALDFVAGSARHQIRLIARSNSQMTVHGNPTQCSITCGAQDGVRTWSSTQTGTGTVVPDPNAGGTNFIPISSGVALTIGAPVMLNLYQASASGVAGPCFKGQRLRLVITQPNTPAAVTFNAAYGGTPYMPVVANAQRTFEFVYDGMVWQPVHATRSTMLLKTANANPSATINTYGTAAAFKPDASAAGLVPMTIKFVWGGTISAETVNAQIVCTFSDGTVVTTAVAGVTATGTVLLDETTRLALWRANAVLVELDVQTRSTKATSLATCAVTVAGLNTA
jgi:hypothetical protein